MALKTSSQSNMNLLQTKRIKETCIKHNSSPRPEPTLEEERAVCGEDINVTERHRPGRPETAAFLASPIKIVNNN